MKTYLRINNICRQQSFSDCRGRLKGLCGLVEVKTDRLMDCSWDLQVPDNLCINVTISSFPNGDPFVRDYFSLLIRDSNDARDTTGVKFYHNQYCSSVITNTSKSIVQLKILKLFSVSKLKFHFQTLECHVSVSFNTITIIDLDGDVFYEKSRVLINSINSTVNNNIDVAIDAIQAKVTVCFNTFASCMVVNADTTKAMRLMPYAYYQLTDIIEFHILLRTVIASFVNLKFHCSEQLALYDGPSFKFPKLNFTCQVGEVTDITASSFQLYIVYEQETSGRQSNLHLSFLGVFQRKNAEHFYLSDDAFRLSWDFTNTSQSSYVHKVISCYGSLCQTDYQIEGSVLEESPQGYLCQYFGIIVKTTSYINASPFQFGPLCSETQMLMIKGKMLTSASDPMHVIIYNYGLSKPKAALLFPELSAMQSCIGIINPCSICSLSPILQSALNIDYSPFRPLEMSCIENKVIISVGSRCVSVYIIPNVIGETPKTCKWQMISMGSLSLKFNVSLRYEEKSKTNCDVKLQNQPLSKPSLADTYKGGVKILECPNFILESRSQQFTISYKCFINYFLQVSVETAKPEASACQTVELVPLKNLQSVPKFQGSCFMYFLQVKNDAFKFEVSLLGPAADEYPNQFSVAAYIEKTPNTHVSSSDRNLKLTISDKMHYSDISHSYKFTDKHMPFVWQSYGKHLTVSLNATLNNQPLLIWIIINAVFEANSLYSYVTVTSLTALGENCLKNNRSSPGVNYCFSVHTNFTGSWLESKELCKKKGGELWKPNKKHIWNEVMRSSKSEWYLQKNRQPIVYDGRINALPLLRSSSLMYLTLIEHDQEVNKGLFLFVKHFELNWNTLDRITMYTGVIDYFCSS